MALSLISKTLFRQSIQIFGKTTGSFAGSAKRDRARKQVSARESKSSMGGKDARKREIIAPDIFGSNASLLPNICMQQDFVACNKQLTLTEMCPL